MPAPRKWTEADNAYLRANWTRADIRSQDIVDHLKRDKDTIRMQAKRLGCGGRPRVAASHEWPEAHKDHAKAEWIAGRSADHVSRSLRAKFGSEAKYSRSAVIGLCVTRLKLVRNSPASLQTAKAKPPAPAKVFKVGQGNVVFVQSPPVPPVSPARADSFKPLDGFEPVRWTERGKGCAWPLDGLIDGEIPCCGAPKVSGKSYCISHSAMATAPTGSTKELMRGLRRIA